MSNKINVSIPIADLAKHLQLSSAATIAFVEAWCTISSCKTDLTLEQSAAWIHRSDYAPAIKMIHSFIILEAVPKFFIKNYQFTTVTIYGELVGDRDHLMVTVEALPE